MNLVLIHHVIYSSSSHTSDDDDYAYDDDHDCDSKNGSGATDDAWDDALPTNTRLSTFDPVAGRIVNLDTSSRATLSSHAHWKKWRESWLEKLFPQADARIKVNCDADILATLVRHFQQHQAGGRW